ncbi:MAG: glycosyl transferase family 28 [Actinobacteria bacterium]|nr:glycosyl transferase family 28 [Actinomycetota bacterium]
MTGPLVAVLVGTDHHDFSRLVGWVHDLAARPARHGLEDASWTLQHGATPVVRPFPPAVRAVELLGIHELEDLLSRAAAVVTHGGPGLIMEARALGHLPLVVPRDPRLGEHVDDHQQRFARRAAEAGLVQAVGSVEELAMGLRRRIRRPADVARSRPAMAGAGAAGSGAAGPVTATSGAVARFGQLMDELVRPR